MGIFMARFILLAIFLMLSITGQAQDAFDYGKAETQNELINIDYLHNQGYTGEGVTIAMLDAGFDGLDSQKLFQRLYDNNQIKATYDFWADTSYVYSQSTHGTYVLSNIGVKADGKFVGAAPDANFLLALTDDSTETHDDERKWKAAMKWADSLGADIISSSLGYYKFDEGVEDYNFRDMDGKTTIVAKAAREAARRGMLVVTSAGNFNWRTTTPCNVDSVLCVGGTDSNKRYTRGAATGPTADGRIKPDVSTQIINKWSVGPDSITFVRFGGTSAAAPMISGLAACLMEKHPDKGAMQVMRAIEESGHQADQPDTLIGHGVPDARVADSLLANMTGKGNSLSQVNMKVYPNPAKNHLNIVIPDGNKNPEFRTISLYSPYGQRLRQREAQRGNIRWHLGDLAKGVYVLRLTTAEYGTLTRKVIKR